MSIATAITAAQGRVADAYTAISAKGGTLPATQNLSNMPTAISSIPTGSSPIINSLSVTPTTSAQTFNESGVDGYKPVSVAAVTAAIDANIAAGNIKSGVTILGVAGSVTELNGSTKTVTPTTSQQTVTPTSPSNGLTSVTVNAVTSAIDSNITAGNIKKDVTILGVTGTLEGGGGGLIITQNFTISGGASWFNLGAIVDSVGYMVVGESSYGETKIIGCLFDTDGKVITEANGRSIALDYDMCYYEEGEEAGLVFIDESQGSSRHSIVRIDLS